MLDYTPSVPPLPPLKYGSDGQERPSASMGAAAQAEVDEVGVGGGMCVTLWHLLWWSKALNIGGMQRKRRDGKGVLRWLKRMLFKVVASVLDLEGSQA